jgi:tetratricopeptide (TPR) repeat protein
MTGLRRLALGGLVSCAALAQPAEQIAEQASAAMQRRDYASAEQAYRKFIHLSPDVPEAYSNLALACYSQNKIPCAEQALAQAHKLAPDLFVPNFLLGEIRFHQGRYQEALGPLEKALALQPETLQARRLYAATFVGLKQYDRAMSEYNQALKTAPHDIDSYYGLGSVCLRVGQEITGRLSGEPGYARWITAQHYEPSEQWQILAVNAYKDAVEHLPSVPGVRIGYARLEIIRKNWDAAREALEAELRLDPQSYEARFHLARIALSRGDANHAAQLLEESVQIRPEFFDPLPELALEWTAAMREACEKALSAAKDCFAVDYLRSESARAGGQATEAKQWALRAEGARGESLAASKAAAASGISERLALDLLAHKRYEQGLEMIGRLGSPRSLRPETRLEAARALYRTRRYEEMISFFSGGVPKISEINYLLGQSYKQLALERFSQMARLAPESARSHQVLGDAYSAEERYYDAIGEYQAAVKLEPGNAELLFELGNSYFKQTQYSLAVASFDGAIRLDPLHAEAHLMRGDALVQLGETEEALKSLNKCLELDPGLTQAHVLLGKAYSAQGRAAEALAHLERVASTDKDGSLHYQIFLLYRKLNQPERAAAALRAYQELRNSAPRRVVSAPNP